MRCKREPCGSKALWICIDLMRYAFSTLPMRQASLREIAELVRAAGTHLPEEWLAKPLHELKHHGPATVLKEVTRLLHLHPHVPELD